MKVKNCNAAVSSLAGMRCDFPTTNFMALGQCNCSNYFTLERQARAGCSQSPDSRSHFPLALSPTRKRIFLPSWLTFGGNVCRRELARIREAWNAAELLLSRHYNAQMFALVSAKWVPLLSNQFGGHRCQLVGIFSSYWYPMGVFSASRDLKHFGIFITC